MNTDFPTDAYDEDEGFSYSTVGPRGGLRINSYIEAMSRPEGPQAPTAPPLTQGPSTFLSVPAPTRMPRRSDTHSFRVPPASSAFGGSAQTPSSQGTTSALNYQQWEPAPGQPFPDVERALRGRTQADRRAVVVPNFGYAPSEDDDDTLSTTADTGYASSFQAPLGAGAPTTRPPLARNNAFNLEDNDDSVTSQFLPMYRTSTSTSVSPYNVQGFDPTEPARNSSDSTFSALIDSYGAQPSQLFSSPMAHGDPNDPRSSYRSTSDTAFFDLYTNSTPQNRSSFDRSFR